MSSAAKTEKPTQERLKKEARKGRSFQSRDLLAAALMVAGVVALAISTSLQAVAALYTQIIASRFRLPLHETLVLAAKAIGWTVAPVLAAAVATAVLLSLYMSRARFAPEAVRIDLNRVNPVNGFKNLFSMKVIKDLLRSLFYLLFAGLYAWLAVRTWGPALTGLVHATPAQLAAAWLNLGWKFGLGLLAALAPVYLLAGWLDHVLFIREMKMDKDEVKRERKEQEMKPELRKRRQELSNDLPVQTRADTVGSNLILANPTHIAIGIYVPDENLAMPFVSVRERGRRARQVIALAEASGVPVVRDVRLARSIYFSVKRYRFVSHKDVDAVMALVRWLGDVERAHEPTTDDPDTDAGGQPPALH